MTVERLLPALVQPGHAPVRAGAWAGLCASLNDHCPMVGAVPDTTAFRSVFAALHDGPHARGARRSLPRCSRASSSRWRMVHAGPAPRSSAASCWRTSWWAGATRAGHAAARPAPAAFPGARASRRRCRDVRWCCHDHCKPHWRNPDREGRLLRLQLQLPDPCGQRAGRPDGAQHRRNGGAAGATDQWVAENRHPDEAAGGQQVPVQRQGLLRDDHRGADARNDFRMTDSEEFFIQLKGDVVVRIRDTDGIKDIPVREGETFFIPPNVPHSPQRGPDTIGLVVERRRPLDGARAPDVLLREVQRAGLRQGVHLPRHRAALRAGDGGVLGQPRALHMQEVRHPRHAPFLRRRAREPPL